MVRASVFFTARLIYFWLFIVLFHLVVGALAGRLLLRLPIDEWPYWFAGCIAALVGRFPLLDEFLDERL